MKKILSLLACCALHAAGAQTLDRMQWFNEPERWSIDDDRLTIYATPHSDYWRIYGDYRTRFDQAGLMLRIDAERWIKAGIEYVDGRYHLSCVVTDGRSDWSVIALDRPVETVWIKAVRRLDAVEIYYSFDDDTYTMMRNAPFRDRIPVQVGMMAASPDGDGFEARFDGFRVTHLPDLRRTEWLERHAAE